MTLLLFAISIIIFVSGCLYHGTKENLLTVVAIVGCLPACKSLVGLIMMMMQRTKSKDYYAELCRHAKDLTMAYEMVFTTYEINVRADAVAICGNTVVCLADGEPHDKASFIETHLTKMLKSNGYTLSVHVLTQKDKFTERLDSMNKNRESLERGIDPSRNEKIKGVIMNLAL